MFSLACTPSSHEEIIRGYRDWKSVIYVNGESLWICSEKRGQRECVTRLLTEFTSMQERMRIRHPAARFQNMDFSLRQKSSA
ncbi:hypothetical protein SKAU_G00379660 [Synaphobranchus kaupii]|uniref:Uncharacterized protein n=1 Tax=Synaphobranchus kaupii TaxID=118154 RepID=A0A9Q1EDE7_SYNKA|nr:hypothetical protein SKAU_G00379660 [Synaphobranchus kaupii]